MSAIVEAVLQVAPRCDALYLDALRLGEARLTEIGITTPLRRVGFLSQFLAETSGGSVVREHLDLPAEAIAVAFAPGRSLAAISTAEAAALAHRPEALAERAYGAGAPAMARALGNRPGDGFKFRGAGPFQLRGRIAAYKFGKAAGVDFMGNPDHLVSPTHVLVPALLEWKLGNLNVAADRNDQVRMRRIVQGAYEGIDSADQLANALWPLLKDETQPHELWQAADPDPDLSKIQEMLNALGATPQLEVSGRRSPATVEALRQFQEVNGLRSDGWAGLVTVQMLRLRIQSKGPLMSGPGTSSRSRASS